MGFQAAGIREEEDWRLASGLQEWWPLFVAALSMPHSSGDLRGMAEGWRSSGKVLLPLPELPMHIVSLRPCHTPSCTLFISRVLDS